MIKRVERNLRGCSLFVIFLIIGMILCLKVNAQGRIIHEDEKSVSHLMPETVVRVNGKINFATVTTLKNVSLSIPIRSYVINYVVDCNRKKIRSISTTTYLGPFGLGERLSNFSLSLDEVEVTLNEEIYSRYRYVCLDR